MDEPELRIGGWVQQKKRGKIRRLFSFLLIITVSLLLGGPMLVNFNNIQVNDSLYLNSGVWNGPFQQERIKEFNGHLKVTKNSYETLDGESGKLIILSLSSLISLEYFDMHNINVNKVKEEIKKEGLELTTNGNILSEINNNLPTNTNIYQWDAKATNEAFFFEEEDEVFIKVYSWNVDCGDETICKGKTIICIAIAKDLNYINQATEIIEKVN
tara:strand:+ start:897 stop:1538 length:642 start_codon:yes stop_codon:yes gene_type:complete